VHFKVEAASRSAPRGITQDAMIAPSQEISIKPDPLLQVMPGIADSR
jgi:hypothetical protein